MNEEKYKGLLDDIINPARSHPRIGPEAHMMQAFAKFLAELAEDAKEQTEKNLTIQRRLVRATWLIFILTLAMFSLQLFQILRNERQFARHGDKQEHADQSRHPFRPHQPINFGSPA